MRFIRISEVGHETAAKEAAEVLLRGGVVLYPTDTLYGLGVVHDNQDALARLRTLKGRDVKKPISLIVSDHRALELHADMSEGARALAAQHLPGALTLVLPAREHIPQDFVMYGGVGLRIPDDPFTMLLARTLGKPYTATSANISGHATQEDPMSIVIALGPRTELIDLVIDDGERAGGTGSTVVRYTDDTPVILREGRIPRDVLGL